MKKPQRLIDIVLLILVPLLVVVALVVPAYIQREIHESELRMLCAVLEANVSELEALRSIATEIGVPVPFEVPEVPAECAECQQCPEP